jgi:hypothetical protein
MKIKFNILLIDKLYQISVKSKDIGIKKIRRINIMDKLNNRLELIFTSGVNK